MCMNSGGVCCISVEVMAGYSEEQQANIIAATTNALKAIDEFTKGRATDVFGGLSIVVGEDIVDGGGRAVAEENKVLLNGTNMLLSLAQMRELSGAYGSDELLDFPDQDKVGGALEYTLVHEMAHVLDGVTKSGHAYKRIAANESPTRYGSRYDEWNADNKGHEAFAEGFAHAVYSMPISPSMRIAIETTVNARLQEVEATHA